MFLEHFALEEQPFGVTPDSRFFYLGPKYRSALNTLISGAQPNRGVLMLTAEPGMGKTSLLFHYLQGLRADSRTAFLFQTAGESVDLLRYLLADLGLSVPTNDAAAHELLNHALCAQIQAGGRFILVIDDAHKLHGDSFQWPRLLADFDKPWMKLIQIVIAGRPKLAECLEPPSMASVREGISSCIRLTGFTPEETCAYIDHRLRVAGCPGDRVFTPDAQLLIAMQTGGVPRHINALCFNSMWIAYTMGARQVNSTMVREAVADLIADAERAEQQARRERSALHCIFAPFGSRTATNSKPPIVHPGARLSIWASAFTCLLLFLVVVSGAFRKTGLHFPLTDEQPIVGTTVAPALVPSFAQAPVTMTIKPTIASNSEASIRPVAATARDTGPVAALSALPTDQIVTVVLERHSTLRHVSLKYLGRFDPITVAEILRLNPFLIDPNKIETNAKIRLPLYLRRAVSHRMVTLADGATSDSPAEKQ